MYVKDDIPTVFLPGWDSLLSTPLKARAASSLQNGSWEILPRRRKEAYGTESQSSIQNSIFITYSRYHDSIILDEYEPYKWATHTMGKDYVVFEALLDGNLNEVDFVTSPKSTMRHDTVESIILTRGNLRDVLAPEPPLTKKQNDIELSIIT